MLVKAPESWSKYTKVERHCISSEKPLMTETCKTRAFFWNSLKSYLYWIFHIFRSDIRIRPFLKKRNFLFYWSTTTDPDGSIFVYFLFFPDGSIFSYNPCSNLWPSKKGYQARPGKYNLFLHSMADDRAWLRMVVQPQTPSTSRSLW